MAINVTVWNEYQHEKTDKKVQQVYPEGIHEAIREFLDEDGELNIQTATLDEPEHGLTQEVLESTDVLIWWGHMAMMLLKMILLSGFMTKYYVGWV